MPPIVGCAASLPESRARSDISLIGVELLAYIFSDDTAIRAHTFDSLRKCARSLAGRGLKPCATRSTLVRYCALQGFHPTYRPTLRLWLRKQRCLYKCGALTICLRTVSPRLNKRLYLCLPRAAYSHWTDLAKRHDIVTSAYAASWRILNWRIPLPERHVSFA